MKYVFYRVQLAALHFNENSNHDQAIAKDGTDSYENVYPKYKKGGYTVRKVTVSPSYGRCGTNNQLLFILW